jgi:hypothetical protein
MALFWLAGFQEFEPRVVMSNVRIAAKIRHLVEAAMPEGSALKFLLFVFKNFCAQHISFEIFLTHVCCNICIEIISNNVGRS